MMTKNRMKWNIFIVDHWLWSSLPTHLWRHSNVMWNFGHQRTE